MFLETPTSGWVSVRKSSGRVFARFLAILAQIVLRQRLALELGKEDLFHILQLAKGVSKAPSVKNRHLIYFR